VLSDMGNPINGSKLHSATIPQLEIVIRAGRASNMHKPIPRFSAAVVFIYSRLNKAESHFPAVGIRKSGVWRRWDTVRVWRGLHRQRPSVVMAPAATRVQNPCPFEWIGAYAAANGQIIYKPLPVTCEWIIRPTGGNATV